MSELYAQDGVNVLEGDDFSRFAGSLCQATYQNSPYLEVRDFSRGHFRGPRGFRLKGLPERCYMDMAPDGDGTKPVLVDAAGLHYEAGYGIFAMTGGDITRWGGLPLALVNNLDVHSLGKAGDEVNTAFRSMLTGLYHIACKQKVVLYKGETAELGVYVGTENPGALTRYLWSGVMLGAYDPDRIITGDQVEEGMVIMALREKRFRNNGISSVRKALALQFGEQYFSEEEAQQHIKQAAAPAVLYDQFLTEMNGWYHPRFQPIISMYLIVHLTGGAIKSKLAEDILFPRGLSATLDNLWQPPEIMRLCAQWRGMTDEECYAVWNGGQGALVVIQERDVERFKFNAARLNLEARAVGRITRENSLRVTVHSKFTPGKIIEYTA